MDSPIVFSTIQLACCLTRWTGKKNNKIKKNANKKLCLRLLGVSCGKYAGGEEGDVMRSAASLRDTKQDVKADAGKCIRVGCSGSSAVYVSTPRTSARLLPLAYKNTNTGIYIIRRLPVLQSRQEQVQDSRTLKHWFHGPDSIRAVLPANPRRRRGGRDCEWGQQLLGGRRVRRLFQGRRGRSVHRTAGQSPPDLPRKAGAFQE